MDLCDLRVVLEAGHASEFTEMGDVCARRAGLEDVADAAEQVRGVAQRCPFGRLHDHVETQRAAQDLAVDHRCTGVLEQRDDPLSVGMPSGQHRLRLSLRRREDTLDHDPDHVRHARGT